MSRTLYLKKKNSKGKEVLFPSSEQPAFITEYTYSAARMGGVPTITGTVKHPLCLDDLWTREEYVEFEGVKFYVTQVPTSSKSNDDIRYKHEITFRSERDLLDNIYFFDVVTPQTESQYADRFRSNATKFSFYGDIKEFVSRLNDSLVYSGIGDKFNIIIDEGIESDTKEISFSDKFFSEALQEIFNIYELPYYWVGNTCHVGECQAEKSFLEDEYLSYGQDKGLLSVSKTNGNYRLIDRVTGIGSSNNIPYYYPNSSSEGTAIFEVENMNLADVQKIDLGKVLSYNTNLYQDRFVLRYSPGWYQYSIQWGQNYDIVPVVKEIGQPNNDGYVTWEEGYILVGAYVYATSKSEISLTETSWEINKPSYIQLFERKTETVVVDMNVNGQFGFHEDNISVVPQMMQIVAEGWYFVGIRCTLRVDQYEEFDPEQNPLSYISIIPRGVVNIKHKGGDGYFFSYGDNKTVSVASSGIELTGVSTLPCEYSQFDLEETIDENGAGHYRIIETIDEDKSSTTPAAIRITGRRWITPQQNLMPPIYLESDGTERFYNAINNEYEHPDGGYYVFPNEYVEGKQREGIVSFDDIMPTIKGVVNANNVPFAEIADIAFDENDSDVQDDEGNYIHSYFYIRLNIFNGQYGFNLFAQALETGAATINMTSGNCAPCAFEIAVEKELVDGKYVFYNPVVTDGQGNLKKVSDEKSGASYMGDYIATMENRDNWTDEQQNTYLKSVWVAVKKETDTFGIVMPNSSNKHRPSKGDTFVITNILMPDVLIRAAENRLKEQLIEYLAKNNVERFDFSNKLSRVFIHSNPDIASKINENSKINVVYNDKAYPLFVTNYTCRADGNILNEISVELATELSLSQNSIQKQISAIKGDIIKATSKTKPSSVDLASLDKRYLSKLSDDTAKGEITFEKGVKFGQSNGINEQGNATLGDVNAEDIKASGDVTIGSFASGLTGSGAKITKEGNGEMRSLRLWESLEVPEIRYNRISINIGFDFDSVGGGIIESVTPDHDENGNILNTGTCTLKLEDGEAGAIALGDLCMGMWHDVSGGNATEDSDDKKGSFTRKGFKTIYFLVQSTSGSNNKQFRYILKQGTKSHPYPQMHFAQRGNIYNQERQAFRYTTTEYSVALQGVNTWEFSASNIYEIRGKLDGWSMTAIDDNGNEYAKEFSGYGQVFGNAYMFGHIDQFDKISRVMSFERNGDGMLAPAESEQVKVIIKDSYGADVTQDYSLIVTRNSGDLDADKAWGERPISKNTVSIYHDDLNTDKVIFVVVATNKTNSNRISGMFTVSKYAVQEVYMGQWNSVTRYAKTERTYPTVTHLGCKWHLKVYESQGNEPMPMSNVWEVMNGTEELSITLTNSNGFVVLVSNVATIVTLHIMFGSYDVTDKMLGNVESIEWSRDTGDVEQDKLWTPTFVNEEGTIITPASASDMRYLYLRQNEENADFGQNWTENRVCHFNVTIDWGDIKVTSCFSSGFWTNEAFWINNDFWKK